MAVEALQDLTDKSTSDEVSAYAEQVVKEVEQERAGEQPAKDEKSDSQIVAEQSSATPPAEPKQTVEEPSDSPSADNTGEDTAPEGEDTGTEEASWLDDDLKAEATAYGIEESELADFESREELERALRLFDKSALEAGRKALADSSETDTGLTRNEKGQFEKKEPEPKAEPPAKPDGQFEITLDTDLYDEGLVDELTRLRDHYESRLGALESRIHEQDTVAKERHFDQLVDSLDHSDLFGKTDKETDKERQRREDLYVEAETYLRGREVLGRPAELNKALLNRIARSLFAEELGKKDLKQRTRKIAKQSNGRQGGGATRPQDPREDPRDEFDRLYRELERA